MATSRKGSTTFDIPNGFKELLEQLVKEVLRAQPKDIYSFCASHTESMLLDRDRLRGCTELANGEYIRNECAIKTPAFKDMHECKESANDLSLGVSHLHEGTGIFSLTATACSMCGRHISDCCPKDNVATEAKVTVTGLTNPHPAGSSDDLDPKVREQKLSDLDDSRSRAVLTATTGTDFTLADDLHGKKGTGVHLEERIQSAVLKPLSLTLQQPKMIYEEMFAKARKRVEEELPAASSAALSGTFSEAMPVETAGSERMKTELDLNSFITSKAVVKFLPHPPDKATRPQLSSLWSPHRLARLSTGRVFRQLRLGANPAEKEMATCNVVSLRVESQAALVSVSHDIKIHALTKKQKKGKKAPPKLLYVQDSDEWSEDSDLFQQVEDLEKQLMQRTRHRGERKKERNNRHRGRWRVDKKPHISHLMDEYFGGKLRVVYMMDAVR